MQIIKAIRPDVVWTCQSGPEISLLSPARPNQLSCWVYGDNTAQLKVRRSQFNPRIMQLNAGKCTTSQQVSNPILYWGRFSACISLHLCLLVRPGLIPIPKPDLSVWHHFPSNFQLFRNSTATITASRWRKIKLNTSLIATLKCACSIRNQRRVCTCVRDCHRCMNCDMLIAW